MTSPKERSHHAVDPSEATEGVWLCDPEFPEFFLFHFYIINAIIMTSHQSCEVIYGPTSTRS